MKRVDLSLLPALHELLKTESVTQAADNLCLSQSAVSKMLTKLRSSFDDELLIKSGRGFVRSKKADLLLTELAKILPSVEALWQSPTLDLASENRTIKIAGTDLDIHVINQALMEINQAAPKLALSISLSHTDSIADLTSGKLDILMTAFDVERPELVKRPLFNSEYVVVSNKELLQGISLDKYLSLPHLSFQLSNDQLSAVDIVLDKQQLKRTIVMWVPTFQHALSILKKSDNEILLTLPKKVLGSNEQATENLFFYQPPFDMHTLNVHLYYHKKFENDPLINWIVSKIEE